VAGPLLVNEKASDEAEFNKALRAQCINMARKWEIPVVTAGHAFKSFLDDGFETEAMGIIEIVNLLKDPEWKGLKGKGQHDLVIFIGVTYYIASQGLSTLKHFAPHLKTVAICKSFHPNADVSFPNRDSKKWLKSLEELNNLKMEELHV
jgi:acetyl-CoA decarbonylase/synthase complex subunit epsilon